MAFHVQVSAEAYVYLFQVSPDGGLVVLFPNDRIGTRNPLAPGAPARIPPGTASFRLNEKDLGTEKVYIAVSRREIRAARRRARARERRAGDVARGRRHAQRDRQRRRPAAGTPCARSSHADLAPVRLATAFATLRTGAPTCRHPRRHARARALRRRIGHRRLSALARPRAPRRRRRRACPRPRWSPGPSRATRSSSRSSPSSTSRPRPSRRGGAADRRARRDGRHLPALRSRPPSRCPRVPRAARGQSVRGQVPRPAGARRRAGWASCSRWST